MKTAIAEKETATNFELVSKVNAIAGNNVDPKWGVADRQLKIIDLEYKELREGIEERDVEKMRDGLQDVLVTVYGLAYLLGLDADQDMRNVCDALLTRFDRTASDQKLTEEKYNKINVVTFCRDVYFGGERYYVTIVSEDCVGSNGEKYSKGKWLKSHAFKEPVYEPLKFPIV